jgi:hypothetical protein
MKTDPWDVVRSDGDRGVSYFVGAREFSNGFQRVWRRMDDLLFDRSTDGAALFPHRISMLIWITISALLWVAIVWFGLKLV